MKSLRSILGKFRCSAELIDEIVGLIAQSGIERKFFTLLTARLFTLSRCGVLATKYKEFEPIESGVYSMHISGSGFNIRVLYGFLPNREPVLLLAFYERGGKSKTDYSAFLPTATKRFSDQKGLYNDQN